jgi:hypothetical protein
MADMLADAISEKQAWIDVGSYLMTYDVPSIATQYVTLFTEAGTSVADGVSVRMLVRELQNVAENGGQGIAVSELCVDAFAYGYAEKIDHLISKGKCGAGDDGRAKRYAYMNARKQLESSGQYSRVANPGSVEDSIRRILEAQQAGMQVKPGSISTEQGLV